uniref:Interleukin 10 receptor, alpha n=1 Tax=Oryzias latipes TaxID=8090 RepID=H2LSI5_ORYLA
MCLFGSWVTGNEVPQPEKLDVNVCDGEVTVLWEHPVNPPSNYWYNVQIAIYGNEWRDVSHCTRIMETQCEITNLIDKYERAYVVKVRLVTPHNQSIWTAKKRFYPNKSALLPPSFTVLATSSSLSVVIQDKPILKKVFPYGVTFTIYLDEIGPQNKTTTAYLKNSALVDQRNKIFTGLQWGRKYCVRAMVEGNGALYYSNTSEPQCMNLPEQEWFILAVSSLSSLGLMVAVAIIGGIILCYVKPTVKTPAALKSTKSGWIPLSLPEGPTEVVTDKGWFLWRYREENGAHLPVTATEEAKDNKRTSVNSWVSIETNSAADSGGSPPSRQEDSGCGSMMESENSTSSQTEYPLKDERTAADLVRNREDSGLGMDSQLEPSSINLDGTDSAHLTDTVTGGTYLSQRPSVSQSPTCNEENKFSEIPRESILAEVVTGYRAGPQSCICSGAGQCSWCLKFNHFVREVSKHRTLSTQNGQLDNQSDLMDSYNGKLVFSSYASEPQMETVIIHDGETTILHMNSTFPLLASLPQMSCGQDFNMNNVPLSLCDLQMTDD